MSSVSTVWSVVLTVWSYVSTPLSIATVIAGFWLLKKDRKITKDHERAVGQQQKAVDHLEVLRKNNSELAESQAREVDRQQKAIGHLEEVSNDLGEVVKRLIATTVIQRRAIRNLRRGMGWMVGVWLVIAMYVVVLVLRGM